MTLIKQPGFNGKYLSQSQSRSSSVGFGTTFPTTMEHAMPARTRRRILWELPGVFLGGEFSTLNFPKPKWFHGKRGWVLSIYPMYHICLYYLYIACIYTHVFTYGYLMLYIHMISTWVHMHIFMFNRALGRFCNFEMNISDERFDHHLVYIFAQLVAGQSRYPWRSVFPCFFPYFVPIKFEF